jgi:hypothetical protein
MITPVSGTPLKRLQLPEEVLQELLALPERELVEMLVAYWRVPLSEVYGEWKTTDRGGFFGDFRTAQGQRLSLPHGAGLISAQLQGTPTIPLEPGSYYGMTLRLANHKTRARLSKPFALETSAAQLVTLSATLQQALQAAKSTVLAGKAYRAIGAQAIAEAEQLVRARFKKMSSGDPELQQGYAGLLKNYQLEMYLKPTRFLYELLQNADDQPYEGEPVDVTFTLLDHHLVLQHTGASFTDEDVLAISTTAQSVKRNRPEATGYKGIGFKSVFTAASPVYIQSPPYTFRFEKPAVNADDTPWQVQPIWTPLREWHSELQDFRMLRDPSLRVSIALYSGSEKLSAYRPVLTDLLSNLQFLLFLRHVGQLQVWDGMKRQWAKRHKVCTDGRERHDLLLNDTAIASYSIAHREAAVPEEETKKLAADEKVPDKLRKAKRVRFSFAAELDEQGGVRKIPAGQDKLYCYLPTEVSYQLGFLLNADFVLKSDREGLQQDNAWNNFLFAEIGRALPGWLAELAVSCPPEVGAAAYQLLPTPMPSLHNISHYQAFSIALAEAVATTACVLTTSCGLVAPAAAVLDGAGLAAVLPELYAEHLTTGLELVHPAVAKTLTGGQEKLLDLKTITQASVLALVGKATVTAYTPRQAVALLQHIYRSKDPVLLSALKTKPWLFDQHDKALTPNLAGQFGMVNEQPDADLPFGEQLRYLHPDLQTALRADEALLLWFETEFAALPPLTRAAALSYLGGRLGAGQVTQGEATAVARYLFGLYGKKELGLVGESKTLGKLPVLGKDGAWRLVTQLYVADYYQPNYPFETLAAELGGQFMFVAESYCAASEAAVWGTFWGQLGAKRPAKVELLTDSLLPMLKANKLSEAGHDSLLKFAIKLYSETKPGVLDTEWPKLGALRLRTVGQGRQALTDCLVNDAYPAGAEEALRLLPQGLPMQLAAIYATVPKVEPMVVRQFLAAATGKAPVTADSITVKALIHLTGAGAPTTLTESVRVVRELVALAAGGKLASSLKSVLGKLPLYLKNGQTQVAGCCYLSTEYAPKLDIEQLTGGTEKAVLDSTYLVGAADGPGVRKLLTEWLGTREELTPIWYASLSVSKASVQPDVQPFVDHVSRANTNWPVNSTVEFKNLLTVNNIQLVKTQVVAKHLAESLAGKWSGKPDAFPTATYQISGQKINNLNSWFNTFGGILYLSGGPVGKLPLAGDRYLSSKLKEVAPKGAWVAVHDFGSSELERYLGLQTELSLEEQLSVFAEQSERLQSVPLAKGPNPEFEKLVAPLLAHFKEELKGQDLSAWRTKLRWPAADGSWRPLTELHWLAADIVKQCYAENRPQLLRRTKGLTIELRNFCLALKVSIIQAADFRPLSPADGGRPHTTALRQRAADNHLLRLLVHRQFGYDEPDALARLAQELAGLHFIEVPMVQLECARIPGFVVPVEDRCRVDDAQGIFYFSGALFTGWRHLPALGKFLEHKLSGNAPAQMIVDVLRARDAAEVRECLREAGWAVPDWLASPRASSLPPPPTQAQTSLKPVPPPTTSLPAPEPIDYGQEDTADVKRGDGGAHALYSPGVSAEKRKDYQKEAREAAVPWLREHGYTVDDKAHDGYSTFEPVVRSTEGTSWRVVVKSYRGGILYLNPNEWLTLAGESSFLLLYKPRQGQAASAGMELITSLDEVHRRNPNVIVRLENTDPKGSIVSLTQLADAHQFSGSFKFIFDSPSNKEFDFELTGNHTAKGPLPVDDLDIDLS